MSLTEHVSLTWGMQQRAGASAGRHEAAITHAALDLVAQIIDDPGISLETLDRFLTVEVESTGQIWVYSVDLLLQNLALGRGDQSRVKEALELLARASP